MKIQHKPNITYPYQRDLVKSVSNPKEFIAYLNLNTSLLSTVLAETSVAYKNFPLRVTKSYLTRITKGNINDPLLKQILPTQHEIAHTPNFISDPLEEAKANPIHGLLHKYRNRVLIMLTGTCAIHCRYCCRREFPYPSNIPTNHELQKILNYIKGNDEIEEVILSGGDPLTVSDYYLANLAKKLATIPHLNTLRIHSRMPIVSPKRIRSLIKWLPTTRLKPVLVIHCNHPQEISAEVKTCFKAFTKTNITLLNQSVLLNGINDNAETLINLSKCLFDIGVLPYYLHLPDKVKGTAHFDISQKTAKQLMCKLMANLPGYLVPRLAQEIPGQPAKTLIPINLQ